MSWREERDALIAQTLAFVQSAAMWPDCPQLQEAEENKEDNTPSEERVDEKRDI